MWATPEDLERFVWNTIHARVYDKKPKWFAPMATPHLVLWWLPEGHRQTVEEGMERLRHLTTHGESHEAFGWRHLPNVRLWMERRCG